MKSFPMNSKPMKPISTVPTPSRSSSRPLTYLSLLALGAGLGVGSVAFINPGQLLEKITNPNNAVASPANSMAAIPPSLGSTTNFVTDVVKEVGPAVVRINSSRTVTSQKPGQGGEGMDDPFFRNFFGGQTPHFPDKQVQRGTGSGFIISDNGQILTNAHVVDGADSVTVTLKDGRTLQGKVMGTDPLTDVAVVKIEANNLPKVKLGDSNTLQVGQWAIAIGNPLGLDNTVTTGIVSATGRSSSQVGVGNRQIDFIQTDAAINPGNSGGPLLNANGEVIGMNTAIIQNAQGIGFAIPISKAQAIAEQLVAKGKVDHPYLGIQMVGLTPEIKEELKSQKDLTVTSDRGVLVVKVVPHSPAEQAGFKPGDIIASVDNQAVKTPDEVQKAVAKVEVGNELPVTLDRQGQSVNLSVKVGVFPKPEPES
jgi:S1-C subfamily serine protease